MNMTIGTVFTLEPERREPGTLLCIEPSSDRSSPKPPTSQKSQRDCRFDPAK
jgi:hypothetical protein